MEPRKVLIVEDSAATRDYLTELVKIIGFDAYAIEKKSDFLDEVYRRNPDLVLLGSYNNTRQLEAFSKVLKYKRNGIPILLIDNGGKTARPTEIHPSVNFSSIPSTFEPKELKLAISSLTRDCNNSRYQELREIIIGQSPAILQIKRHIKRLSKSDVTVLITGESGTGKELIARAIHKFSTRASNPFIKVNSAALPTNLLESELFGFEKGAFTGACQQKPGKFKLAHSGSLLLDEIGEIPLALQAKLLQVLEDSELSALGSTTTTRIDVRVFAVTNANLAQMVSEGHFRSDLYHRLNVVALHLPPLRERKEDIGVLTNHLLEKYAARYKKEKRSLNETTMELFHQYSWPGNIRELENIIQSITVLGNEENFWEKLKKKTPLAGEGGVLSCGATALSCSTFTSNTSRRFSLKEVCKEAARKAETEAILDVLYYTRWNRRKAAELLKISYKALLNKISDYNIEEQFQKLVRENAGFNGNGQNQLL